MLAKIRVIKFSQLLQRDFIRHNLIFFIGTLLISIFNYIYYPVVGRLVPVADFGEVQAIISLYMQLGLLLTAFGYVVINIIANTKNHSEAMPLILKLERITLYASVALFILLYILSFALKSSFKFSSVLPIVLVGVVVILNIPVTSRMYFLQGMKRLKEVSITGILFAAGKLVITVVLIWLGVSVVSAVFGYILALILALLYLHPITRNKFPSSAKSLNVLSDLKYHGERSIRDEVVYGLAILMLLSGVTLLYLTDTIVVRLFFDENAAGLYSAVASVARIIFFITASVSGVLIATIKYGGPYKQNLSVLYKSLGLVVLVGGVVAAFFALFPNTTINLLFGAKYEGSANLLPLLSLVMLICSFNNLLVCYEIALRRFRAIYIVGAGVLIAGLLIIFNHDSLSDIIFGYMVGNMVVLLALSVLITGRSKRHD